VIAHAGCLSRFSGGRWRGVLLQGSSGAGKSDLALRLLERGWRLIADDRVRLWAADGRLYGRAPDTLAGLIEARGLAVTFARPRAFTAIDLLVDCLPPGAELDRIPPERTGSVAGISLPRVALRALETSAPAKLELALARPASPF
jgi:serine kinase of HPr protein (carbohydrate metabolism regulator)